MSKRVQLMLACAVALTIVVGIFLFRNVPDENGTISPILSNEKDAATEVATKRFPLEQLFAHITRDVPTDAAQHVYVCGTEDSSLDAGSLAVIDAYESRLFEDKNHIYGSSPCPTGYLVTNYDRATFAVLDKRGLYFKDKHGLYFRGNKTDWDPQTFKILNDPTLPTATKDGPPSYAYASDARAVYYFGDVVPGADPVTFVPIENGPFSFAYGKDKDAVYHGTTTISGADPRSVEILWQQIYEGCGLSEYVKDRTRVFFEDVLVAGADPGTFESMIDGFGKDKNGIWEGARFRPDLPKNFEPECTYG